MPDQDITPPERVAADPLCDREVTVYGFLRGTALKPGTKAHLAGVGDLPVRLFSPKTIDPHPCPATAHNAHPAGGGNVMARPLFMEHC